MYLCAVNNILAGIMPRQECLHSATGIYHVMLRGINKQDIFEDDEDWIMRTVPKFLLWGLVLTFCCCISHADEYQYWDDLDENSKSEIIQSIDVDKSILKLYLHEITLSDNDLSTAILDTLCTTTNGYKKMLYFFILNEIVKNADGAFAEILGEYCVKYVNNSSDYALEYFSNHHDVGNEYSTFIAAELYYNDISITKYRQQLLLNVKGKCAKDYLPIFLNEIEHELNIIDN